MTTTSSSAAAFDLAMLLPAPPDDSAAPRWRAQAALASNYAASQHALRTSAARTCFPTPSAAHIGTGRSEPRWPRGHSRAPARRPRPTQDRKRVGWGQSVEVRVDLGGPSIIKKNKK